MRWAFTSFGWSVLLIASAGWLAAERIQPAWLVTRACRRALRLVERPGAAGPETATKLATAGASLAELATSSWLPYAQFREAVVSYVAILAARCRVAGAIGDVTSDVRDLAAHAQENAASARTEALILALGGLGIAQAHCAEVHAAACQALLGLATRLRASGSKDVARKAFDALADVTDARVELLLPDARIPELESAPGSAADNDSDTGVFFRGRLAAGTSGKRPLRWWPTISIRPDGFGTVFHGAAEPLKTRWRG